MFREKLAPTKIQYLIERDEGMCVYCGGYPQAGEFEIDHVFPHSLGGSDEVENLVFSCWPCNRYKSNRVDLHLVTKALLHLMLKGEDLGWIAQAGLSEYSAFATPLYVDIPDVGPGNCKSSLDYWLEEVPVVRPVQRRRYLIVEKEGLSIRKIRSLAKEVRRRVNARSF